MNHKNHNKINIIISRIKCGLLSLFYLVICFGVLHEMVLKEIKFLVRLRQCLRLLGLSLFLFVLA